MAAKKFGYVRVSTREQNPERQIHILRDEEGIDERDIYVEKESGRQFERPVYRSLVDNILREGDLLVVTELKRFGRNYGEIYKEWFHITKEIGADIKVTSMPILDTTQSKELVGQLITDVVLAVFAYVADEDGDRRDYGGIHCGEVFEFKLNDVWIPARMEMGDDRKWYLVGLLGLKLDGLEVRQG